MCGDGHHITDPNLDGAIRCMRRALADAGIEPEEIDYINPHATSTPVGDRNEARAISRLFPHQPLVSATKSQTGHLLGAAGAMEAIFTILSLQHGLIPPTLNHEVRDPECAWHCLDRSRAGAANRSVMPFPIPSASAGPTPPWFSKIIIIGIFNRKITQ